MFTVYFINLFTTANQSFETAAEAVAFGKTKGFEFRVDGPQGPVCWWSIIGGMRWCVQK